MSGNVSNSLSNEFTWSVDIRPFGIRCDHPIKQWKDRVSALVGNTLGELNDLRIVMSRIPKVPKS
jgi:hypothetical protein